jgi:hypothetical protein
MTPVPTLPRDALTRALNGDQRLVRAFEQQALAVGEAQEGVAANVESTEALQDATFLTLSSNASLNGERVLRLSSALRGTPADDTFDLDVSDEVPRVNGGFPLVLVIEGETTLVLPLGGALATLANFEILTNKTLSAPKLANIGDYADDIAAATAGVALGAVYRTGSALKVRVA